MPAVALDEKSLARTARQLARRDERLSFVLKRYGPPPLWARRPGYATLVQIILEQQVSLASAASIFARLKKSVVPFQPARMLELGAPHLKSLGLTRQKTDYCVHLSRALAENALKLSRLARLSDAETKAELMKIKGLGSWSADVYLLMALRRPDIWPASDLALAIAATDLYELPARPSAVELMDLAEAWRPFRSVAARMLWQYYLAQRKDARRKVVRAADE